MNRACAFRIVSFLLASSALVGCAGGGDSSASSAQDVVGVVRLDAVTAAEVGAAAEERFEGGLAKLAAAHPEVTSLARAAIGDFVTTETPLEGSPFGSTIVHVDHELADALRGVFTFAEAAELPVADLEARFRGWLAAQLPAGTVASGNFDCALATARLIGVACTAASDAKAIATAGPLEGVDMAAFVASWKETFRDGGGTRFVRPVRLTGEPTSFDVKRIAGVTSWCPERAWGAEAVDAYLDGRPTLAAHAAGLKGPGIHKRWYWACGGDSWGEEGFAILDAKNQVWAFTMFASE
jgi:hypothetical protein